jgi:hypothetical protein
MGFLATNISSQKYIISQPVAFLIRGLFYDHDQRSLMTKQHTKHKSKAIHNLRSAATGIFRATGNTAAKGIEKTAKWMATDHAGSVEDITLMQSPRA